MTPPVGADDVRVTVGVHDGFLKRHRKNPGRAAEVWRSLVGKRAVLLADSAFGPLFTPPAMPGFLKDIWPLRVIKGLPHGFRAVYSVFSDPNIGLVVRIQWVGDHKEYDALFGYATS